MRTGEGEDGKEEATYQELCQTLRLCLVSTRNIASMKLSTAKNKLLLPIVLFLSVKSLCFFKDDFNIPDGILYSLMGMLRHLILESPVDITRNR